MQVIDFKEDDLFLLLALDEEKKAWKADTSSVFIGYVLVEKNHVIQKGHLKVLDNNTLLSFTSFLHNCRLNCTLYFSKEIKFLKKYILFTKAIKEKNITLVCSSSEEAAIFYESRRYYKKTTKPFVIASMAQSLDGKIALKNSPVEITSHQAKFDKHKKRFIADVIVTTAQTVINDNPKFNARIDRFTFHKKIAIIDSKGRLNGNEQLFLEAQEVHIFSNVHEKAFDKKNNIFFHHVQCNAKTGYVDVSLVFKELATLGFFIIWLEAGAKFMGYVHHHNLVNRTYLYIAPKVIGIEGLSVYEDSFLLNPPPFTINWLSLGMDVVGIFDWHLCR
jgi:diaminohydroxyphosphoribosylaminopyrimidine deaminase/5-amino-6-(5-phosphoribosylamino)uracil reductase